MVRREGFIPGRYAPAWGVLLLLTCSTPLHATITFHKTYGGYRADCANDVVQTADGGYAICGATQSYASTPFYADAYVVKTDSLGGLVWERVYGGAFRDSGACLCLTPENGYVIVGRTESFGQGRPGVPDVYLIKIDSTGDTVWTRTYGGAEYDAGYCVQRTHDRGYVIVGSESSAGPGLLNVFLLKTDSLGDTAWTRTYGGGASDEGLSVQQTADRGYVIVGASASYAAGDRDVYLIKTDSLGDTLWTRTYGGVYDDVGFCVEQTLDLGYIVTGYTSLYIPERFIYLLKTDSVGNELWARTYGGRWQDRGYSVHCTPDGGYIVAGHIFVSDTTGVDAHLIKTDSLGDTIWTRTFGGVGYDIGVSAELTGDGGFVIAGRTNSFGEGSYDMYVVKTDSNGVSDLKDASVLSMDAPKGRVFAESLYTVRATVRNSGQVPFTFEVTSEIGDYSDTVQVLELGVDSTFRVEFKDWLVPSADSVIYRARVCTHATSDFDSTNDCAEELVFGRRPFHDVGTIRVESPPEVVLSESICTVALTVRNYGDFTESFRVQCAIDGYADEVRVRRFPPDAIAKITLRDWIIPSDNCTTYTMKYCTYMPDDARSSNDGGVRQVHVSEESEPLILSACASDGAASIPGIDDDDFVLIAFDEPTNKAEVNASNIDSVLALSNGHTWRDGRKQIGGAVWNDTGDTLSVFLSTTVSSPSLAVGDTVTPDGVTIRDKCGNRARTPAVIAGSFGPVGTDHATRTTVPKAFRLFQNQPNPFENRTLISYAIPSAPERARVMVCVTVHDVTGRIMETLVNEVQKPGVYRLVWSTDACPDGLYFCRLRAGSFVDTKKMILIR